MELDTTADPRAATRTVKSLVVPRPIGWISTVSADGRDNLAPFSYFNAVCSDPPTVMFSAGDRDGALKDTPRNALDTGEFVVNLVTPDLVGAVDATSESVAESEFETAGLDRSPASTVAPPRVADALAHLECTVVDSVRIGDEGAGGSTVVFGRVRHLHVDDDLLTDGSIDARKVEAVARYGGPFFARPELLDHRRQN